MMRDNLLAVIAGLIFLCGWALHDINDHLAAIAEQMGKPIELKQPIVVQPVKLDLTQPASMVNDALLPPPPKEKSDKGEKKH